MGILTLVRLLPLLLLCIYQILVGAIHQSTEPRLNDQKETSVFLFVVIGKSYIDNLQ